MIANRHYSFYTLSLESEGAKVTFEKMRLAVGVHRETGEEYITERLEASNSLVVTDIKQIGELGLSIVYDTEAKKSAMYWIHDTEWGMMVTDRVTDKDGKEVIDAELKKYNAFEWDSKGSEMTAYELLGLRTGDKVTLNTNPKGGYVMGEVVSVIEHTGIKEIKFSITPLRAMGGHRVGVVHYIEVRNKYAKPMGDSSITKQRVAYSYNG